ncbi:MAG TPA: thioesterase family protein [Baekduia sp.]|nr:thioesterase family protein [Baekduia sp.]
MTGPTFAADTAVAPDGACEITGNWNAPTGPNGGYLAAILLRGMQQAVGDPARPPRSLTCHYLRAPKPGPAHVETTIERTGRSLTTVSARLVQDGRPAVLGLGAFSGGYAPAGEWTLPPPEDFPAFEDLEPVERHPKMAPIAHRFEMRWAVGALPFTGGPEAVSGGWLRLAEERPPLDGPLVALLTDAWMPASFSRLSAPALAPTIDLTIHFRAPLPLADTDAEEPVLLLFRTRHAQGGFAEEDGEVWTRDGRLLAMSRQLSLLR